MIRIGPIGAGGSGHAICAGLYCQNLFGSGGSKSESSTSSTSQQVGASDSAHVAAHGGKLVEAGALNQESGATYVAPSGTNVTGGSRVLENAQITTADPAVLQAALDAYTAQNKQYTESQQQRDTTLAQILASQSSNAVDQQNALKDLINSNASTSSDVLNSVLGSLTGLAQNQQTGGETGRNNIVLYTVLAVIALLAMFIWKRRP